MDIYGDMVLFFSKRQYRGKFCYLQKNVLKWTETCYFESPYRVVVLAVPCHIFADTSKSPYSPNLIFVLGSHTSHTAHASGDNTSNGYPALEDTPIGASFSPREGVPRRIGLTFGLGGEAVTWSLSCQPRIWTMYMTAKRLCDLAHRDSLCTQNQPAEKLAETTWPRQIEREKESDPRIGIWAYM